MKRTIRIIISGVLIFLIPVLVDNTLSILVGESIPGIVYNAIDIANIIIIEGLFLVLYFRKLDHGFLSQGIVVGVSWGIIYCGLVFSFSIGSQMSTFSMIWIDIASMMIPAFSITVGYVSQNVDMRKKIINEKS